uniref:coadhesin-like n=1 Tax=Ciona intestinalis TaxID=7719 RepID=UPI000EF4EB44
MISFNLLLCSLVLLVCVSEEGNAWLWNKRRRACDRTACVWHWGACSRNCGGGTQSPVVTRNKGACGTCDKPSGPRACNTQCCAVSCAWASWSSWGGCSGCGLSSQTRNRRYSRQASCGGSACSGSSSETRSCNAGCCSRSCRWGSWSVFSSCSRSCGGGIQTKTRSVARSAYCGGSRCSGPATQSQGCNTQCCPRHCEWWGWTGFNACSVSCGGGTQSRSRSVAVSALCGGNSCPGNPTDTRVCNTQCCPVHCSWGNWGRYGSCSRNCGGGTQTRSRSVAIQPSCGGSGCPGSTVQSQRCNAQCCPRHCEWWGWTEFNSCSVSCGGGNQTRSRSVAVSALCGGNSCAGDPTDTRVCNTECCPVNCQWSSWSPFNS